VTRTRFKVMAAIVTVAVLALAGVAAALGGGPSHFRTTLDGFHEQPLAISTNGNGTFTARIDNAGDAINYTLTFGDLTSTVTQAHIHLGAANQVGGVAAFLCTNVGNGPAGTQTCPTGPGPVTITGTIHAADVIGPASQNLPPGDLTGLIAAMRAGSTYVNVHSMNFPIGEIRGPLGRLR